MENLLLLVGLVLLASSAPVQAQGAYAGLTADVAVPSPTAASLGEYGEIPVSLYTGRVSVEVPIYTLQSRTLSLPISLSYHGGGVRVNEKAGAAGLGWTLNAGGAITRVVRGLPDDVRDGYLYTRSELDAVWSGLDGPAYGSCVLDGDPFDHRPSRYLHGIAGYASVGSNCGFNNPNHEYYDPIPDVFAFNFGGYSGKFIIDPAGIRTIPHQNLKISYTQTTVTNHYENGDIMEWSVVTEDGTTYVFAKREGIQASGNYSTAWYLTQIQSATGTDVIDLSYTSAYSYNDPIAQLEANLHIVRQWDDPPGPPGYNNNVSALQQPSGPAYAWTQEVYLSKITAGTGAEVVFSLGSRDDLTTLKRYSSILIESETGARIQRVALTHGYFNDGAPIPGGGSHRARQMERLRLDAVQVYGETDATTVPGYSFDYYGESAGQYGLPKSTSTARDHWGYFNGNGGGGTNLIPSFTWGGTVANPTINYQGVDRESDDTGLYMRAGSLSKVTYPTGGSTTFEYEPHTYSKIADEEIDLLASTVVDATTASTATALQGPGPDTPVTSLTVTSYWGHPVSMELDFGFGVDDGTSIYDLPRVELWEGSTLVWSQDADLPGLVVDQSTLTVDGDQFLDGTTTISVSGAGAGVAYQLRAFEEGISGCASNFTCEAEVTATWHNKVLQAHPHTMTAGGLRIKKTVNHDGVSSSNDVVTEYSYVADEDIRVFGGLGLASDRSSGVLVRTPRYLAQTHPEWEDEALRAYASDVNATGIGTHIGYRQVTVRKPGQGKTVHFFLTADGLLPNVTSGVGMLNTQDGDGDTEVGWLGRYYETSRDWKRGLPTVTLQFDEAGNVLQETRRGYIFSDESSGSSFPKFTSRALNHQLEVNPSLGYRWVTFYEKMEILSAVALPSVVKTITHE